MEFPFTREAVVELTDVCQWVFDESEFPEDAVQPDGNRPFYAIRAWLPWIIEALDFSDGDGTLRRVKYGDDYSKQPALDIRIYRTIRNKWNSLQNKKMNEGLKRGKKKTRRRY